MGCLGNIIWMLCGGLISALGYLIAGCIWCITIVGIPVGMQCFKLAGLALFPFGKDVTEYSRAAEPPVQYGVSHLSRRTEPHCL